MKNLVALLLLFAVAFGLTLWFLGRERVVSEAGEGVLEDEAEASIATLAELVEGVDQNGEVLDLSVEQFRAVLLAELLGSATGRRLLESAREIEVEFRNGQIEAGLILVSSEIERRLRTSEAASVGKLLRILTLIPGRETYLGVLGTPAAADGALILEAEGLELVIGPLRLEPSDLQDALGVEDEQVEQALRFRLDDLHVDSAEVAGQRLRLRVRPRR